jgi:alpha-tubulin suppressor-like RCC1 family protein
MNKRRLLSVSAVATALGLAACTALIGIEDLKLKPPVTTDAIAFGAAQCGTAASPQTLTLSNPSESTYSWSARFEGGTSSPFDFEPKSGVLPKGQQVAIVITPRPGDPDASPEPRADTLTIVTDLEGDTPHSVRVTTGVPKLVVTTSEDLVPRPYPVGAFTRAGSITVANQGNAPANVTFDGGPAIRVTPDQVTVQPDASAVFELSFSPDTTGDGGAALGIFGGAGCAPQATISVAGDGVLTGASAIQSGGHTCALVGDRVACWGSNSIGQIIEDKKGTNIAAPTVIPGLRGVKSVSTGNLHTCAALEDKSVWCWGNNLSGQLGRGTIGAAGSSGIPARVVSPSSGSLDAIAVSAGGNHTCALSSAGTVFCWGANGSSQLGNGASSGDTGTPVQVIGLVDATAISAGDTTTCALRANKTVVCWGNANNGQTGDGTFGDAGRAAIPVAVLAANGGPGLLQDVEAIESGYYHSCALLTNGQVACWGYNNGGEVGRYQFTTGYYVTRPVLAQPDDAGPPIAEIASLAHHRLQYLTCAVHKNRSVLCWGSSSTRGNPFAISGPVASPVLFDGGAIADIVGAGSGPSTACALQASGSVFCWGSSSTLQTGTGTTTFASQAVKVIGFP